MPLRGIVTPLITPLLAHDRLDAAGVERLVEHVVAGGVSGLFVLGTTGEGPALPARVRREMIAHTCRAAKGRLPILVGITDSSYGDAVELALYAAEAGADAVVSAGPLYYAVSEDLLIRYFERLSAESPLPLFLYNMPSCTHVGITVPTVLRAAGLPNVSGIKDSSGDMAYVHQLRRALCAQVSFTLLVGPEELLAESVLLGAHGGVNGGSNLWPRLYVALYEAAASGDLAAVSQLHPIVVEVCGRIFQSATYGNHYLEGLKYAVARLGIGTGIAGMPYEALSVDGRAELDKAVDEIGAKVRQAVR